MIEKLDVMFDDFVSQKDEEKYKWIGRLRRFFVKQPEYKSEYHHPLFSTIIEFHLSQLQYERDLLQKTLTAYEDRMLDGYEYQPQRYLEKSQEVSETIASRIKELDDYISEYSDDLKKRRNSLS